MHAGAVLEAAPRDGGRFGWGTGPIYLDELRCTGSEGALVNCTHNGVGTHDCDHYEDVGVTCSKYYNPSGAIAIHM